VDERARRLSHEELAVADQLATEGHRVESVAERPGQGRSADLSVCGVPVEVKSYLDRGDGGRGRPSAYSVCNKLLRAGGQADHVVINGQSSGLTEATARRGVALFSAKGGWERAASVRVLGDHFDLSLSAPRRRLGRTANARQLDLGR
jgi:hypothetical protein